MSPAVASPRGLLVLAVCIGLASCGKPATKEDCEKIVTRITELELKANDVVDTEEVAAQVTATRRAFNERARRECVGRRLSRSVLQCIDDATSSAQILEECLN